MKSPATKRAFHVAAAFALFCSVSGSAQAALKATDLLASCENYERTVHRNELQQVELSTGQAVHCFAYFMAVHQFAFVHLNGPDTPGLIQQICPPDGPTTDQFVRIFLAYARANPQELHQYAAVPVWRSLAKAFPCK